jgi:hypothetical protein
MYHYLLYLAKSIKLKITGHTRWKHYKWRFHQCRFTRTYHIFLRRMKYSTKIAAHERETLQMKFSSLWINTHRRTYHIFLGEWNTWRQRCFQDGNSTTLVLIGSIRCSGLTAKWARPRERFPVGHRYGTINAASPDLHQGDANWRTGGVLLHPLTPLRILIEGGTMRPCQ